MAEAKSVMVESKTDEKVLRKIFHLNKTFGFEFEKGKVTEVLEPLGSNLVKTYPYKFKKSQKKTADFEPVLIETESDLNLFFPSMTAVNDEISDADLSDKDKAELLKAVAAIKKRRAEKKADIATGYEKEGKSKDVEVKHPEVEGPVTPIE